MAKLFCISDVHGFYNEMREALDNAGFDPNNEEHWLISLGDVWDRGKQPFEVMQYLKRLPRKVLIRGNHENLFEECCERGECWGYDISNGTYKTICILGGMNLGYSFAECCERAEVMTRMFRMSMVNYFETSNFVFCHGFLPINCINDWRNASQTQWNNAMWFNSYDMIEQGFKIEKCVVAGHWNSSYGRYKTTGVPEFGIETDFSPFFYDDKLIMIDAATAYSHMINCLVLEDVFMDDKN